MVLDCPRPIVVAPMAGGPSTVDLVLAAADAGALAFLAGGYKTAEAMQAEVEAVREATTAPFGVNLFVPGEPTRDPQALAAYVGTLEGAAAATWDDDHWAAKVDAVLARPPAVVSFTFGCPEPGVIGALTAAGALVAVTVTSPDEARAAEAAGAALLVVQGNEAGAHRGSFTNIGPVDAGLPLQVLLAEVAAASTLPRVAAGGVADAQAVADLLAHGAVGVQCGTAFLRSPESGAHPLHKAALADPRFVETDMTRAFSGRPARGLVNRFMREHAGAPAAYPEINNATRPMRAAAAARGDVDGMSLYCGTGFRHAPARPAGEIVEMLSP